VHTRKYQRDKVSLLLREAHPRSQLNDLARHFMAWKNQARSDRIVATRVRRPVAHAHACLRFCVAMLLRCLRVVFTSLIVCSNNLLIKVPCVNVCRFGDRMPVQARLADCIAQCDKQEKLIFEGEQDIKV
jgi:hypothetical protein